MVRLWIGCKPGKTPWGDVKEATVNVQAGGFFWGEFGRCCFALTGAFESRCF